jgi:hypothetical protein
MLISRDTLVRGHAMQRELRVDCAILGLAT